MLNVYYDAIDLMSKDAQNFLAAMSERDGVAQWYILSASLPLTVEDRCNPVEMAQVFESQLAATQA